MEIKFKHQEYQAVAVRSVIDCFKGQVKKERTYRIDPGSDKQRQFSDSGFRNADVQLSETQLLENIQDVQKRQNLPLSPSVVKSAVSPINLDIEMETGTGKTYCYTKTIFEMYQRFGWNKFIIVVPSIAIREGVCESFKLTANHFQEIYGKRAKVFIYSSQKGALSNIESYSSDAGINVMIINVQAFNARGKDARRIYEELDEFQSRKPIDVIKANHPILILDEPQKMEGKKTMESFKEFNALMILRYSATHKTEHNKIHRLDALDAYRNKLVKKIEVRGISVKGLSGTNAYLYLESIVISKSDPVAKLEFEVKQSGGIKRITRKVSRGDNLFSDNFSNGLDQYDGYVVSEINALTNTLTFLNGVELEIGEATGDVNEGTLRRIQIREAVKAHFAKERELFKQGIKVLTLFFIDTVAKYRQYSDAGKENGEYAKIFEEEYADYIKQPDLPFEKDYSKYLDNISVRETHNGYFSIDKNKRMVDPSMTKTEQKKGESSDVDAYDLILKDKKRLLSFDEPVRFIFSHSALREGWDNPNVFTICTLRHSVYTHEHTLRQEIGRGLRLCVNKLGDRQDHPATVHSTNILTVVASDSYKDIVSRLQDEYKEALAERPRKADEKYFSGKTINTDDGQILIDDSTARQIYKYLLKNDYIEDDDTISDEYHEAVRNDSLAPLPEDLQSHQEEILKLINAVYDDDIMKQFVSDGHKVKTNRRNDDNLNKKEFQELWQRINKKAVYNVDFQSEELIKNCIDILNSKLNVKQLQYAVEIGTMKDSVAYEDIDQKTGFNVTGGGTEIDNKPVHTAVKYDLIGKVSDSVKLTRRTVANILAGLEPSVFGQFNRNPESFISEASRLINEQKATKIIEHLSYNLTDETLSLENIFTENQVMPSFDKAVGPLKNHVYDYAVTDSKTEKNFVQELDNKDEVVVYAKLPRGFFIPTPVGDYNPDWAISFKEGSVKHIYFIAETKGMLSTMQLREIEKTKIECARKYFNEVNLKIAPKNIRYDVVTDYESLINIVNSGA